MSAVFLITCKGGDGHGGEQVLREVELDEVGESPEGGGIDLPNPAPGQSELLQVDQPVSGEDLPRQDLDVVPREIEHLRLDVDL